VAVPLQQPNKKQRRQDKSTREVAIELWDLLRNYAKQETVDPMKGIGRFLAFGSIGSVLLALGVLFLSLSLLRALQTQTTPHLTGDLNWVPYVATLAVTGLLAALALRAIGRTARREKDDQ